VATYHYRLASILHLILADKQYDYQGMTYFMDPSRIWNFIWFPILKMVLDAVVSAYLDGPLNLY